MLTNVEPIPITSTLPMVKDSKALHSMIFLAVLYIVPTTIIQCEEVIDRIISCKALTLNIQVIDINISKHVSAPKDACDRQ